MANLDLLYETLGWLAASAGAGAMGLACLFARPSKRFSARTIALVTSLLFAFLAAGSELAGLPRQITLALGGLAALPVTLLALRRCGPHVGRLIAALLARPQLQGALLLSAGIATGAWRVAHLEGEMDREVVESDRLMSSYETVALIELPGVTAMTDAGEAVPLQQPDPSSFVPADAEQEQRFLADQGMNLHLMRTAAPDGRYNCHGWIFTNGRCWVRGAAVPSILRDNGYAVVSRPAPGDVAVFRNVRDEVMHTALVRSVSEDGLILLESKWGKLGRYIHTATDHGYRNYSCTYYHSSREGHVLRGLE